MGRASLIEQQDSYKCLVECEDCTCGLKFSMPMIKKTKPVEFIKAMDKFLQWMKKNKLGKWGDPVEIKITSRPIDGGYIHLLGRDSITIDFTHWVYPPIKSAKELLKQLKKK